MKYITLLLELSVSALCACSDNSIDVVYSDETTIIGNTCRLNNASEEFPSTDILTSLPSGSKILLNASGSLQLDNKVFTYSGTNWKSDSPANWSDMTGTTEIIALYPTYINNLYDNLYQTGKLEDILYVKDTFSAGHEIKLQFQHLFSLLTFQICEELQQEIIELKLSTPTTISEIDPVTAAIKFNVEQCHTTSLAGNGAEKYSFIIPPTENMSLVLDITTNKGTTTKLIKTQDFISNQEYKCNIKILEDQSHIGIATAEDLIAFSLLINNKSYDGKTLTDFGITENEITTYRLLNNIELTEADNARLMTIGSKSKEFKDNFDGQEYIISNLIPGISNKKSGLFGYIASNGIVRNLHIENAKTVSTDITDAGILAGLNRGQLVNCSVSNSTVKANQHAGGLAGLSYGTIINCNVQSCKIESEQTSGGGIGIAWGKIINSFFANNNIKYTAQGYGGGIYGKGSESNSLIVMNCYVQCTYSPKSSSFGLFSGCPQTSNVEHCFYKENGAALGVKEGQIKDSYPYDNNFIDNQGHSVLTSLNEWVETNSSAYPEYSLNKWTTGEGSIPSIFIKK